MSHELIDEHAEPGLRLRLGSLLATSRTAAIAIAQMRLAGLDLVPGEVGGLEECRIMLGRLDAQTLHDSPAETGLLKAFAASGRLQIRTAPQHVWTPDFSIFKTPDGAHTTLVGAHYFGRPYPLFGLALTCIHHDPETARLAEASFERLWQAGYDVLPVIIDTLDRLCA